MKRANSLKKQTKLYISAAEGAKAHGVCCPGRDKLSAKRKVSKGFNFVRGKVLFGCADSRFAEPRSSLQGNVFWYFLRRAKSTAKTRSDAQKVAGGKFLCVGDRRNRENCERT